jgi:hypothetical protein
MVTTATTPHTARDLLALVAPFGPTVEGAELVFAGELPLDLELALQVLHTGVRAALVGRAWWGSTTESKPRVVELCTEAPVPAGIGLLCVEGDRRWDRIAPAARLDLPHLFAPMPLGPSARSRK